MMRWILALLLLVNLGLLLWVQMFPVPTRSSAPEIIRPPGVQDILLLREADQQQPATETAEQELDGDAVEEGSSLAEIADDMLQDAPPQEPAAESIPGGPETADVILGPEAESESESEAEPQAEPEPEAESEVEPQAEPETEREAEARPEEKPEAEAVVEAEAESETEPEAEARSKEEPEAEAAAEPEEESEAAPKAEPVCGRIGPYEDKAAAEKYRDDLQHQGILLDIVQTTEQVKNGYWVLIPALPSTQEALQMVAKLKEAGVTDLWRFPEGRMKNTISLGWYLGITRATKVSENIKNKGFEPEVRPKMSVQTRYWMNYRAADEQALTDELDNLSAGLVNEKKACE